MEPVIRKGQRTVGELRKFLESEEADDSDLILIITKSETLGGQGIGVHAMARTVEHGGAVLLFPANVSFQPAIDNLDERGIEHGEL